MDFKWRSVLWVEKQCKRERETLRETLRETKRHWERQWDSETEKVKVDFNIKTYSLVNVSSVVAMTKWRGRSPKCHFHVLKHAFWGKQDINYPRIRLHCTATTPKALVKHITAKLDKDLLDHRKINAINWQWTSRRVCVCGDTWSNIRFWTNAKVFKTNRHLHAVCGINTKK